MAARAEAITLSQFGGTGAVGALHLKDQSLGFQNAAKTEVRFTTYAERAGKSSVVDFEGGMSVLADNGSLAILGASTSSGAHESYQLIVVDRSRPLNPETARDNAIETPMTYVAGGLLGKFSHLDGVSRHESVIQANQVLLNGELYPATLVNVPIKSPTQLLPFAESRMGQRRQAAEEHFLALADALTKSMTPELAGEFARLSLRDRAIEAGQVGREKLEGATAQVNSTISSVQATIDSRVTATTEQIQARWNALTGALTSLKAKAMAEAPKGTEE